MRSSIQVYRLVSTLSSNNDGKTEVRGLCGNCTTVPALETERLLQVNDLKNPNTYEVLIWTRNCRYPQAKYNHPEIDKMIRSLKDESTLMKYSLSLSAL